MSTSENVRCEHGVEMDDDYVPGQIHAHVEIDDEEVRLVEYWWHVWTGTLPEQQAGEGETTITCTLGPTQMSPEDEGMDGKDIKIKDRTLPFQLVDADNDGPEMTYLASFRHEPDDDEIATLREEAES